MDEARGKGEGGEEGDRKEAGQRHEATIRQSRVGFEREEA